MSFIFFFDFSFSFRKCVCKWNEVNECLNCNLVGHTIYTYAYYLYTHSSSVCETLSGDDMRAFLCLKLKNRCCRSEREHIKCRLSTHSPKIASCDRNNLNHVHTQNTLDDNQNLYLLLTTVFWSLNSFRSGKKWKSRVLSRSGFFRRDTRTIFSAISSLNE